MTRARALALTAVVAGACWLGSPARLTGQEAAGGSAYAKMDDAQLARALQALGMTELLDALAKSAPAKSEEDVGRLAVLIQAKLGEANAATQPADKQKLLKEVLGLQEQAVESTRDAKGHKDLYRRYRLMLDRAVTEGITMADPCAERVFYLQARPADYAALLELTDRAGRVLERLRFDMQRANERFSVDDSYMVDGTAQAMEELMSEARYREAWISLYRAMAMDKAAPERERLLRKVIADVSDFTEAEDNSSGVKYMSLLLEGMAYRELGDLDKATAMLELADNKEAGERWQLRALFELCHARIELGPPDKAADAVKSFAENGLKVAAGFLGKDAPVAVDMQSTLLLSRLYGLRAEAAKKNNDARAEKDAQAEALKTLLAFTDKYPQYKLAFIDLIAPKYIGQPIEQIPLEMLMPLAQKSYDEGAADSLAQAEKYARYALEKETDPKKKAETAWYLCWIVNQQGRQYDPSRLFEAAKEFRQFAQQYPEDEHAVQAVENAVGVLREIMFNAKKWRAVDVDPKPAFAQEYVLALTTALPKMRATGKLAPLFHYELGKTYEDLGRSTEAIDQFNLIQPQDELYIPSRYRVLRSGVSSLRSDMNLTADQRKQRAEALIAELKNYRVQAAKYVEAAHDEEQKKQVQDWAVDCDVLVAELLSDPLGRTQEAIDYAWGIIKRWPGQAQLEQNCKDLIVRTYLARGELDQAMSVVEQMAKPDAILAVVIQRMVTRMEELEWTPGEEAKQQLAGLVKNYKAFAEKLHAKPPKGVSEYDIDQALAGAYEKSGENLPQAMEIYEKLSKEKPADAVNIRGLARCYTKANKLDLAQEKYRKLIEGLPERSPEWWRIYVEYLRFMLAAHPKDPAALRSVVQEVNLLRFKDANLGGLLQYFNEISARANELLRAGA